MNIRNFESGIQRAYYVLWFCVSAFYLGAIIFKVLSYAPEDINLGDLIGAIALGVAIVVGPGLLMLAVRWIYRGFRPRQPQ